MHATFAVQLAVLAGVALVAPVGGVAAGGVARSALRPRALVLLAAPKKAKAAAGGGFGKVAAAPSGPTAKELLAQATKTYEAMEALSAAVGDEVTTVSKWSITLRAEGVAELSDWVPVALLALNCPQLNDPKELVPAALAAARREILEAGSLAVPKLRTASRDKIEFGFEPLSSFESNVFNALGSRGAEREKHFKALGVAAGSSAAEIKKAHRKLVMELHPDRFVGDDGGAAAALDRMLEVTDAYESLGGGRFGDRGADGKAASWYEALGGKMRVNFNSVGTLAKTGAEPWELAATQRGYSFGVFPLESEVALDFVARNVVRAASSASA